MPGHPAIIEIRQSLADARMPLASGVFEMLFTVLLGKPVRWSHQFALRGGRLDRFRCAGMPEAAASWRCDALRDDALQKNLFRSSNFRLNCRCRSRRALCVDRLARSRAVCKGRWPNCNDGMSIRAKPHCGH
jgi:hypothetical protein